MLIVCHFHRTDGLESEIDIPVVGIIGMYGRGSGLSPVYTRFWVGIRIKPIRVRVNGLFRVLIRISQPTSGGGSD